MVSNELKGASHIFKTILKHPYFWLLGLVLIAFWPISLQLKTVPFDMTNCWVPWRFYISDVIQNGDFPWWHPYQQMGYPIHSDLQGPVWHLESIFASLIGHQGIKSIQFTLLLYFYIGAIGFYKLASLFSAQKWILFLAAASYVCSGFFTSHTMHLFAIISGAFVPFIIYYVIRLFQSNKLVYGLWAGLFIFFNLTGGNQTFLILTFYLLLPICIYYSYLSWKKGRVARLALMKSCLVFGGVTLGMGAVIFGAFVQIKPYLGRLAGLDYKVAAFGPFSPKSSLSFFNPMSTINEKAWLETDFTMSNAYFGLLFLVFFLFFLFKKKSALEKIFLSFSIVALFAAFGSHTPFHQFLFDYVPLLNKFRFPSYYSYFFVLSAMVLGVSALNAYFTENQKRDKVQVVSVAGGIALAIMAMTVIGYVNLSETSFLDVDATLFFKLRETDVYQNLFYYGLFQVPLILALVFALWKKRVKLVVTLVLIDCLVSVQPNLFFIGVGDEDPDVLEASLIENNKDQLPSLNSVKDNLFYANPVEGLWQNVNYFSKVIGPDGFNSNYFTTLATLVGRETEYADLILDNPYVYLSDNVLSESVFVSDTANKISASTILLKPADYAEIDKYSLNLVAGDTVITEEFNPNDFKFKTETSHYVLLNLLQSNYTGWKVYVDDEESIIHQSNTMFMSVLVPPGNHTVVFKYENKTMLILAVISYISLVIVMLILSIHYFRKRRQNLIWIGLIWGIPLLIFVRYFLFL